MRARFMCFIIASGKKDASELDGLGAKKNTDGFWGRPCGRMNFYEAGRRDAFATLEALEVGGDVGDGLWSQAEHRRAIHEGFFHRLHASDFRLGHALGLSAHALDEHWIAVAEDHALNGEAIFGFDLGAFVAVGNFDAGACDGVDDDIGGLLLAEAGEVGTVVDSLLADFVAHVAAGDRGFAFFCIAFELGNVFHARHWGGTSWFGGHFHGRELDVVRVLAHRLQDVVDFV